MKRVILLIPIVLALMALSLRWVIPENVDFKYWKCDEYCERSNECTDTLTNIPAQPANTYSNILYLLAGLAALLRRRKLASVTFATACVILFVGSSWFHALISESGQLADVIGMYCVFSFLASYAVVTTQNLHQRYWLATLLAILVAVPLSLFANRLSSTPVLIITVLIVAGNIILALICKKQSGKKALVILGLFILAFLFRQLDVTGTLCNPGSWFQGHAVWHVLCGIGIYTVFRFFHDIRTASSVSSAG